MNIIQPSKSRRVRNSLVLGIVCIVAALPGSARAVDDNIFPPAPAAKSSIDFDGRGFLINGKRTFIISGSLHYARVPHEQWRDRILRFKRAGYNTIQTYAFWNFHERKKGEWTFDGDADLNAFLKIVKELDMYAVVRVGPYVCAEWENGGYPIWLRFEPGLAVREPNAPFEAADDKWLDHVMPIVAANQIHRGGAVIMVQLENEHPAGWGTSMPNDYFRRLREKALSFGLEVPYFFSGLHHGNDPAGKKGPWDSAGRKSPWYSTEFWAGWFNLYGPLDPGKLTNFDRAAWKMIAWGGNGFNDYMFYGGSNFDHWNDHEDGASYDYGAAVGQAGDLRPLYFRLKRAAMFSTSFPDVLEDSTNATTEFASAAPGVNVSARKSASGTLLFLDNQSNGPVKTQVKLPGGGVYPASAPLMIPANEFVPVVADYKLSGNVHLQWAARVVGICEQGGTTTIVASAPADETAELHFSGTDGATVKAGAGQLKAAGGQLLLSAKAVEGAPTELAFDVAGHTYRILLVTPGMADRTWFADAAGQRYVICGPAYVGEVIASGGTLKLNVETPAAGKSANQPAYVFGSALGAQQPVSKSPAEDSMPAPALTEGWKWTRGDVEAEKGFDDSKWRTSESPEQMGADDSDAPYAWYRATLHAPEAGEYTLLFSDVGDWVSAFVNGKPAGVSEFKRRESTAVPAQISITLPAGDSTLAVFATHAGRDKFFPHVGPISDLFCKGVAGPVHLLKGTWHGVSERVARWNYKVLDGKPTEQPPDLNAAAGWKTARIGQDVFGKRPGFAWFVAKLPAVKDMSPGSRLHLAFGSVDDNATVYLNGKKLGTHQGYQDSFDLDCADAWQEASNTLAILVENTDGGGGLDKAVMVASSPAQGGAPITGWRLRGGESTPPADATWSPLPAKATPAAWYHATFKTTPPAEIGAHPILRLSVKGLSRGCVYINGHNVGHYPDPIPVDGLYLPEPWLVDGENSLLIFDEQGALPTQAHLTVETGASRTAVSYDVKMP